MARPIRIGSGAGFAGDRIDPAVELAAKGNLDFICFDVLAERTIALAHLEKQRDRTKGYGQLLHERMEAMLPFCAGGLVMISNTGAANPLSALRETAAIARKQGLKSLRIAAVTGDDVLEKLFEHDATLWETGQRISDIRDRVVSANAYLGADSILPALNAGCAVIITGRVADPSLYLAPMIHAFGWDARDWDRLGAGTAVGHLLECAGQVSGGYFAEPGYKDVAGLARLGFPLAEVNEDGSAVITKVRGSGGEVSVRTCKEQLLYEIHDPASYLTPDVTADFTGIKLSPAGKDRVRVEGGRGKMAPGELKVAVGIKGGWIGEGEISFAGEGALARAALAAEIVRQRLKRRGIGASAVRVEFIGHDSLLGKPARPRPGCLDVRLRMAGRFENERQAGAVGEEVESLYTNGPAGAAGARKDLRPVVAIRSCGFPRDKIRIRTRVVEVQ